MMIHAPACCRQATWSGLGLWLLLQGCPALPTEQPGSDAGLPAEDGGVRPFGLRDWTRFPAVLELSTDGDLYAVGDIHGDFDQVSRLLASVGLIRTGQTAAETRWSGGNAVLVCPGDLINQWDEGLEVLTLFQTLQASAAEVGGQVVVTLGNHEVELLADPGSAKLAVFAEELQQAGISPAAFAAGLHPLGEYLRTRPLAVRVNDTFFVHAGNTGGRTLVKLIQALEADLDAHGFRASILRDERSLVECRLDPPWWESLGGEPEQVLTSWTTALGAARIVQGHEPGRVVFGDGTVREPGQIHQRYGRIFLIDVGFSRGTSGREAQLIRIRGGNPAVKVEILDGRQPARVIWP